MSGVAGGYTRTNARLNRPDRARGKRAMEKGPDGKFLGVDEARGIARADARRRRRRESDEEGEESARETHVARFA